MSQVPFYISRETVCELITWPMAIAATKEALSAVSNRNALDKKLPNADQPARSFTWTADRSGVLLSMPGYAGNYSDGNKKCDSFGCKLVTIFPKNCEQSPCLPNIFANIMLLDSSTGQLKCVMEATDLTAWRTAAATLNATKYLYFERDDLVSTTDTVLAVIGCGVEGRQHSIGMCLNFNISEVRLWNRTKSKAESLEKELSKLQSSFANTAVKILVCDTPNECASSADIIITATFANSPLVFLKDLKKNVHINAIGVGITHYSELEPEIYSKGQLYVDHMEGAMSELKGLHAEILGEVGEIINGSKKPPKQGLTIFQSLEINKCNFLISTSFVRPLDFPKSRRLSKHYNVILRNPKDPYKEEESSGIYKVTCPECGKIYVGQTKRLIHTRMKKHLSEANSHQKQATKEIRSSVAEHIINTGHRISEGNLELIKRINKPSKLDIYEAINIKKVPKDNRINADEGNCEYKLLKLILNS